MNLGRPLEYLGYACRNRTVSVLVAVGAIAAFVADWSSAFQTYTQAKDLWNKDLNAYAGFATLAVATAVWFGELHQDWKGDLPKKLSVDFEYAGHVVMRCQLADLAALTDVRALAQQIALQMIRAWTRDKGREVPEKERLLDFKAPSILQTGGDIERGADGTNYVHYLLHVTFITLPQHIADEDVFNSRACLVWKPPFDYVDKVMNVIPGQA